MMCDFPEAEHFKFDDKLGGMVLTVGELSTPCVNWYQHEQMLEPLPNTIPGLGDSKLGPSGLARYRKGALRVSYVATLVGGSEMVIAASCVHPNDKHCANKKKGRTIAALRLAKAVDRAWNRVAIGTVKFSDGDQEVNMPVALAKSNESLPYGLAQINEAFIVSAARRLRRLHGVSTRMG